MTNVSFSNRHRSSKSISKGRTSEVDLFGPQHIIEWACFHTPQDLISHQNIPLSATMF